MQLQYYGHSCFSIRASNGQLLLTDPPENRVGYRLPRLDPDLITVSHAHYDHNAVSSFSRKTKIIDQTETVYAGAFILSCIPSWHDECGGRLRGENRIYRILVDGISVVHLGDLGHPMEKDRIGPLDVLLVPIGGVFTIDTAQAANLIRALNPKIAIPMHYRTAQTSLQQLGSLENFLSVWNGRLREYGGNDLTLEQNDFEASNGPCVVTLRVPG